MAILNNPLNVDKEYYFTGSCMNDADLARVRITESSAFFILSDQLSQSAEEVDKKTILRALAVKRYHPHLNALVQIIRPNNKVGHTSTPLKEAAVRPTIWWNFIGAQYK